MKGFKDDKRQQEKLFKALRKAKKHDHVAVGILQDETVADGFGMTELAAVHEFGSRDGHIPERSFIRSTCDKNKKRYQKLLIKLGDKIIRQKLKTKQALTQLGEVVVGDMKETINAGIEPGLKLATIKRKKSSKPLIDTGRLKGSITHEVRGAA